MFFTRPTLLTTVAAAIFLSGCASSLYKAPIEDRGRVGSGLSSSRMPPGYENAGKPGYYTVKPGDNLLRIATEAGQGWRDVATWNNLSNPNVIEVGQVLRIEPPVVAAATAPKGNVVNVPATTTPVAGSSAIETRNVNDPSPVAPAASNAAASTSPTSTDNQSGDPTEPAWMWPATGPVVAGYGGTANRRGLIIGGQAGDPVFAAADGRVVYAGAGLRGYGNLLIIKHNSQYLTAYAHNQKLLVKENQVVRKGETIAEMGDTDAPQVQLHFEIRKQGKPVDPALSLPSR